VLLYCGPFLYLASIPAFYYGMGGWGPLATVILLLFALIGAEWLSPRGAVPRFKMPPGTFRLLPMLYIPAQLAVLLWAIALASDSRQSLAAYLSLLLSVGVTTGVFGMLAAHEMAHSPDRMHRLFATALLTGMTYRQFRIAHIYGHHRWAGTEHDAATARMGEGFYAFLVRTVRGQWLEAWQFEEKRRKARHRMLFANRVLQDALVTGIVFCAVQFFLGWRGTLFLVGESAVAILVLELFNYIAHYGLERESRGDGRRTALSERHSWNSSNVAANMLIFNMGRHSDHHRAPSSAYQSLSHLPSAPELPLGYAGSILLALLPPLWRRVMDPEVLRLRESDMGRLRLAA
jgi:alkane 1-monooxygenase